MVDIKPYASSSNGNMYLLHNEETNILLECGVDKERIRKYLREDNLTLANLDACVISHHHGDHSLSVNYVLDYIDNVYSTEMMYQKNHSVIALKPLKPIKIGTIKLLPIPVDHGEAENNAFVIMDKDNCIFFGTDFCLMEQNVSNFKFSKVFIEENYDDNMIEEALSNTDNDNSRAKYIRQMSTHMSRANCKTHLQYMDLSNCKEIVLLHASVFLTDKESTKKEFESEFKIKTYFAKER